MAILPKWSASKLLHCQVQGPHGNARMEPASTEQLRNSPSIASVSASGVHQQQHIETIWKDKPVEYLENAAVYAVANLCQSILTIEFLN